MFIVVSLIKILPLVIVFSLYFTDCTILCLFKSYSVHFVEHFCVRARNVFFLHFTVMYFLVIHLTVLCLLYPQNHKLNRSLEDTMAKLEESKQLLKTNENGMREIITGLSFVDVNYPMIIDWEELQCLISLCL